jgi:hypothetical protein
VLDRALVFEFWDIDLAAYPRWGVRSINPAHEGRVRDVLMPLMLALSPARLHFGWRVVDDVVDFLREISSRTQAGRCSLTMNPFGRFMGMAAGLLRPVI